MKITYRLLVKHGACKCQRDLFRSLYPNGLNPTIENLSDAAAEGLDAWWAVELLPAKGPGSRRAYALWCAEQVVHLTTDVRVAECLDTVRRRVEDPGSVSDRDLAAAGAAARAAARAAAGDAAWATAWATAWVAARAAQLACLSQLLMINKEKQ